jgi:hypothetical protein
MTSPEPIARPKTFAGRLRAIAAWLDVTDAYVSTYGPWSEQVRSDNDHNAVQSELRVLADALDDEPHLDQILVDMIDERTPSDEAR